MTSALVPALGWVLCAGVASVPLWKVLSEYLPDRLGESNTVELLKWSIVPLGTAAVLAFGGAGFSLMPILISQGGGSTAAGADRTDVVFQIDFGTATGQSVKAFADSNQTVPFNDVANSTQDTVVTAASQTGLVWPSTNALKVTLVGGTGGDIYRYCVGAGCPNNGDGTSNIPVPAVGSSLYYRWYFKHIAPDTTSDTEQHPIQESTSSLVNWFWQVYNTDAGNSVGTFTARWTICPGGQAQCAVSPGAENEYNSPEMDKDSTWRFETRIHRTATDTFTIDMRIYDSNDNLRFTRDSMTDGASSNWTADPADRPYAFYDTLSLTGFQMGNNGWSANTDTFAAFLQGALCVATDNWCGAYPITGVEGN